MARALYAAAFLALLASPVAAEADPVFSALALVWGLWAETAQWLSAKAHISSKSLFLGLSEPDSTVYDISFQDDEYKSKFTLDYSYDQHNTEGENRHFQVQGSPDGSGNALRMAIFSGDKSFESSSDTFPRTELSGSRNRAVSDGVAYSVQWDVYISQYQDPYMFCFAQVFGNGPNVMLRWEQGQYQIWSGGHKAVLAGSVHEDLNQWVTWRMDFKLERDGGYVNVFRRGQSLGQITGDTASGTNSYWKQGIYTQHVNEVKDMTMFVRNLRLATA